MNEAILVHLMLVLYPRSVPKKLRGTTCGWRRAMVRSKWAMT